MNGTDRWTIKGVQPETRAAILAQAGAANLTAGQWLVAAVEALSAPKPAPAYVGQLELAPGVLVRHRAGGPTMCVISPEIVERSPYAGLSPDFTEGGPTGRWWTSWFVKGTSHTAAFWPCTLEPAA